MCRAREIGEGRVDTCLRLLTLIHQAAGYEQGDVMFGLGVKNIVRKTD